MSEIQFQFHTEPTYLLQSISGLLPNLEKIIVVYRNEKGNEIEVLMKNYDETYPSPLVLSKDFDYYGLERLLEGKPKYQWTDEQSLPFKQKLSAINQKDVFSELKNTILLIRLHNKKLKYNDLYLLYFNPDSSNFGPVRNDQLLNTTSKSIIEIMVFNHLNHLKKEFIDQQNQFNQYKIFLERLRDKARLNATKNKTTTEELKRLKMDFVSFVLKRVSQKSNLEIALSIGAQSIAEAYEGSFEKMEKWIVDAFEFARFTDFDPKQSVLVIDEWHLNEPEFVNKIVEESDRIDSKFIKVYSLLDRLESAALKVAAEKKNLTGSAVGQAMNIPISAPAISDALRKNMKKIQSLMSQFPNRWTLIRSEFRPIINVLEPNRSLNEKQA